MSPRTPPGQTRSEVLRFVRRRIEEGRSPTVREVQEAFRFKAVQTAREHLEALVAEGRLTKEPGRRSRAYRLPVEPPRARYIPLLGRVQAGALTTALEEPEGYVAVSSRPAERDLFALRVRGDSMIDAGILEDDLVIVRRQQVARSGDVVVAVVGEEATVKTWRRKRGRIELHPANDRYPVLVPDPKELYLLGRVIELHRYFGGPRSGPRVVSAPTRSTS